MQITEKKYYDLMCNFSTNMKRKELIKKWYLCFYYICKEINMCFTDSVIHSLFYHFGMDNWKDLHLENTIYKGKRKKTLLKAFCSEAHYICDRVSYDRLFRTHWLFLQAIGGLDL